MSRKKFKNVWSRFLQKQKIVLFLSFFATIFMSIGYASINDISLSFNGVGNILINDGLRITNIVNETNNYADDINSVIDFNDIFINSTIILGNRSDSSITYRVTVDNNTDKDYRYYGLLYDGEASLFYDNNNIQATSNNLNTLLASGQSMDILLTFSYADGYTPTSAETLNSYIKLNFEERYVARIGSSYYDSLQLAVDAVPTDNTNTTIVLLRDTDEYITVAANKTIVFDLNGKTFSNTSETATNYNIINYGNIEIQNGTIIRPTFANRPTKFEGKTIENKAGATLRITSGDISSEVFNVVANYGTVYIDGGRIWIKPGVDQGVVNNEGTGTMYISGGEIIGARRQALYNLGVAYISGDAYLENGNGSAGEFRACVQNAYDNKTSSNGTLTITGGTIVAKQNQQTGNKGYGAVWNNSSNPLTIGTKDGTASKTTPIFISNAIGIHSTANYGFFDGIIKSVMDPFNNTQNKINDTDGFTFAETKAQIDGTWHNVRYLVENPVTVTFDGNGGTPDESSRILGINETIGDLPEATRAGRAFAGWFTAAENGTEVDKNYVVTGTSIIYAQWDFIESGVCKIQRTGEDPVFFASITDALSTITDSTATTITMVANTTEYVTIPSNRNITLNLNGKTLNTVKGKPTITNKGNLTVSNGTMLNNDDGTAGNPQSIINQEAGTLIINDVTMTNTSGKQALYITGGTSVRISGNSTLTAQSTGSWNNQYRCTVQVSKGSLYIDDGVTIINNYSTPGNNAVALGVYGTGIAYIGDDDGTISSSSPVIQGETYAIHNEHTLNFYDGIIKGKTGTVDGTITNEAANSQEVNGTSNGYYTKHLEANNQQQQQSPQQQMQQAPVLQQSEESNETSGDTQVNQTIVDPETNSTSEPNETSED